MCRLSLLKMQNLSNDTMFKPNQSIFLGGVTKPTLTRLLNERDITFYAAAHSYFKSSLSYILKKFSLKDEFIRNAVWIDVSQRIMGEWECVQYFYDSYSTMFEVPVDILDEEFCDYLTLNDSEIGMKHGKLSKYLNVLILMETRCVMSYKNRNIVMMLNTIQKLVYILLEVLVILLGLLVLELGLVMKFWKII